MPNPDYVNAIMEADFTQTILDYARSQGWLCYHTQHSQRSESGFPDLVLVHAKMRRLIFAEVKKEGGKLTKGRISPRSERYLPGQRDWIDALEKVQVMGIFNRVQSGSDILPEVYVWRPSHWPKVESFLRRRE